MDFHWHRHHPFVLTFCAMRRIYSSNDRSQKMGMFTFSIHVFATDYFIHCNYTVNSRSCGIAINIFVCGQPHRNPHLTISVFEECQCNIPLLNDKSNSVAHITTFILKYSSFFLSLLLKMLAIDHLFYIYKKKINFWRET